MASTEKEIIGAPQDQHVLLTTDNLIFSMSRYLYLHIIYRLRRRERLLDMLRRMGQRREKWPVAHDAALDHPRAPGAMICLTVETRDESFWLPDTSHAQRVQAILESASDTCQIAIVRYWDTAESSVIFLVACDNPIALLAIYLAAMRH